MLQTKQLDIREGDMGKTYFITQRHPGAPQVPADWQQRLTAIPGVVLLRTSSMYAQFSTEAEGLQQVQSQFATDFIIEEVRQPKALKVRPE